MCVSFDSGFSSMKQFYYPKIKNCQSNRVILIWSVTVLSVWETILANIKDLRVNRKKRQNSNQYNKNEKL